MDLAPIVAVGESCHRILNPFDQTKLARLGPGHRSRTGSRDSGSIDVVRPGNRRSSRTSFVKMEAPVLSAIIGSVTALVVLGAGRHLERRNARRAWLLDQTLAAASDFLTAYEKVMTHFLREGGRSRTMIKGELGEHLIRFGEMGGDELNTALSRISLLGDWTILEAAYELGHHVDECFNASFNPAMEDFEKWRGQLYDGQPQHDAFVHAVRRSLGSAELQRPFRSYSRWKEEEAGVSGTP